MDRNQSKQIDLVLKSLSAAMEQLKVHGQEAAIEITHSKLSVTLRLFNVVQCQKYINQQRFEHLFTQYTGGHIFGIFKIFKYL